MLENRRFQIGEIARAFNLPVSLLGDLERATWGNSEQQQKLLIGVTLAQSQVLRDHKLGFFGKMAAYTAIGAAGFGVVAALKGGGSSAAKAPGGGGSTPPTSTPAQAATQRELKIEIIGGNHFSRDQVQDMLDQIRKEVKNGARLT